MVCSIHPLVTVGDLYDNTAWLEAVLAFVPDRVISTFEGAWFFAELNRQNGGMLLKGDHHAQLPLVDRVSVRLCSPSSRLVLYAFVYNCM